MLSSALHVCRQFPFASRHNVSIASYQLEYDQLTVLSTDDQYVSASALAFMQG
jgi:hypothetical protein